MKKLIIILLFLTTTQIFAKEKTIKFHPPETDAERALDRILRVESKIIKGKNKKKEICTQEFLKELHGQRKYYEECQKSNIWCDKKDLEFLKVNYITGSTTSMVNTMVNKFNFYLTSGEDSKLSYISVVSTYDSKDGKKDFYYSTNHFVVNYIMKKENEAWKIDGICNGRLKINHKSCYCPCTIDPADFDPNL